MVDFIQVFAVILGALLIALATLLAYRSRRVELLSWGLISIAVFHCFAFSLVIASDNSSVETMAAVVFARSELYIQPVLVVMFASGLVFGWFSVRSQSKFARERISNHDLIYRAGIFSIFVWFIAMYLYAMHLGGFIEALAYTRIIRSGLEVANPFSFMLPFGGLAVFPFIVILSVFFHRRNINTFLWVLIALPCYIYSLTLSGGRVSMVFSVCIVVLMLANGGRFNRWWLALLSPIAAVLGIVALHGISIALGINSRGNLSEYVVQELSFPAASLALHIFNGTDFRWFIDYLITPIYLMPSSWHLGLFDNVGVLNTVTVTGVAKGVDGGSSSIPVDVITMGWLQAGPFGVVLLGCLVGVVLRITQRTIDVRVPSFLYPAAMAYATMRIAIAPMIYADPPTLVGHLFGLIAFLSVCWALNTFSRFRITPRR